MIDINHGPVRLGKRVPRLHASGVVHVQVAFLEQAEPSVGDGLARFTALGASELTVLPCLPGAGTHLAQDSPKPVSEFRAARRDIRVRLMPRLGASDALPLAILGITTQRAAHA